MADEDTRRLIPISIKKLEDNLFVSYGLRRARYERYRDTRTHLKQPSDRNIQKKNQQNG